MKRIFVMILVIICTISLSAQDKYSFSAKTGLGIPMNTPHLTPFSIEAIAHYNLTTGWAFGAGTGFMQYDNISTIPLYANVKYTINPKARYNMFAGCSIGYGFALGEDKNGGLYLNPEFGVQRKMWNKILSIAVGYQWQNLERLKSNSSEYASSLFVEKLYSQALSIKLGITF